MRTTYGNKGDLIGLTLLKDDIPMIAHLLNVSKSHIILSVGCPILAVINSQPLSVTSIVCSNWADLEPSMVTAVQPENAMCKENYKNVDAITRLNSRRERRFLQCNLKKTSF